MLLGSLNRKTFPIDISPIYVRSSKFFVQCYLLDWLKFILHILLQIYCISGNKLMQVSNICSLEIIIKRARMRGHQLNFIL